MSTIDKKYIGIYNIVLQNNGYLEKKVKFLKKIKMGAYITANMILNSYDKSRPEYIHIVAGKSELRLIQYKNFEDIYYGDTQKNLKDLLYQKTLFSYFTRKERLMIFVNAILIFFKNRSIKGPVVYWIDFLFWNEFLNVSNAKILLSNGHYDRLTTSLSYLCKSKKILFHMRQHGIILANGMIPNKIFCDKLYVFDERNKLCFKNSIIRNMDCEYIIEYKNNVRFSTFNKKGRLVGIIENPCFEMKKIINCVINYYGSDTMILIMLHPLSKERDYKEFKRKNVEFISQKIWNIDLLISATSTLAYDYIRNGFTKKILFVDLNGLFPEYKNTFGNLVYLNDLEGLEENLHNEHL